MISWLEEGINEIDKGSKILENIRGKETKRIARKIARRAA